MASARKAGASAAKSKARKPKPAGKSPAAKARAGKKTVKKKAAPKAKHKAQIKSKPPTSMKKTRATAGSVKKKSPAKSVKQTSETTLKKKAVPPLAKRVKAATSNPQMTQGAELQAQFSETRPVRDFDNLDYARRHTTHTDGQDDDGWGRSAGHGQGRISQMSQYAADDDELAYGRKHLGGRNRIPGAGSKRNR